MPTLGPRIEPNKKVADGRNQSRGNHGAAAHNYIRRLGLDALQQVPSCLSTKGAGKQKGISTVHTQVQHILLLLGNNLSVDGQRPLRGPPLDKGSGEEKEKKKKAARMTEM